MHTYPPPQHTQVSKGSGTEEKVCENRRVYKKALKG